MKKLFLTGLFGIAIGICASNAQTSPQDPSQRIPADKDQTNKERTTDAPLYMDTTVMDRIDTTGVMEDSTGVIDTTGRMNRSRTNNTPHQGERMRKMKQDDMNEEKSAPERRKKKNTPN